MIYNAHMPVGKRVYNARMPDGKRIYNVSACIPAVCDGGLITVPNNFADPYWTKNGTSSVVDNDTESPSCAVDGDLLLVGGFAATNNNGIYSQTVVLSAAGVPATVSIWLKRVSTTGELKLVNPFDVVGGVNTLGQWRINMALLSDNWEFVDINHPAVTVDTPFLAYTSGDLVLLIGASDGVRQTHAWCAHLSET